MSKENKKLIKLQNEARKKGKDIPTKLPSGKNNDINDKRFGGAVRQKSMDFSITDIGLGFICLDLKDPLESTLFRVKTLLPGCFEVKDDLIKGRLYMRANITNVLLKIEKILQQIY